MLRAHAPPGAPQRGRPTAPAPPGFRQRCRAPARRRVSRPGLCALRRAAPRTVETVAPLESSAQQVHGAHLLGVFDAVRAVLTSARSPGGGAEVDSTQRGLDDLVLALPKLLRVSRMAESIHAHFHAELKSWLALGRACVQGESGLHAAKFGANSADLAHVNVRGSIGAREGHGCRLPSSAWQHCPRGAARLSTTLQPSHASRTRPHRHVMTLDLGGPPPGASTAFVALLRFRCWACLVFDRLEGQGHRLTKGMCR